MRGGGRRDVQVRVDRARPDHQRRLRLLRRPGRPAADRPARRPGRVSLAWTALTPTPTADAIFDLDTATDWTSFREAASSFAVPAQNIVYADRDGHIGYQAPGLVPIRKSGNDGLRPQAGWRSENDWTGDYVPFDGLPNVLDPDEGFVVTANQAVIGPDYPYHLTDDWDQGYRSAADPRPARAADRGAGRCRSPTWPRSRSTPAARSRRRSCPTCSTSTCRAGTGRAGQRQLRHWDFDQPADSAAGRVLQRGLAHPAGR